MQSALLDIPEDDLEPSPGRPNRALGVQIVKHGHPNSYSTLLKQQQAVVRYKWHHGINKVVQDFRAIPELRDLIRDRGTGGVR
jgi:hypothetical protein